MTIETNEPGDRNEGDDAVAEAVADGDIVADVDDNNVDDNVGDLSVEINVEELVAKIESGDAEDATEKARIRKKLDEVREQRDDVLDSTYNFNLDDDL